MVLLITLAGVVARTVASSFRGEGISATKAREGGQEGEMRHDRRRCALSMSP